MLAVAGVKDFRKDKTKALVILRDFKLFVEILKDSERYRPIQKYLERFREILKHGNNSRFNRLLTIGY